MPADIPEGFLELVHRLMAWSPADRPRDAYEVTRVVTSLPEAVVDDDPGVESACDCPVAARGPDWFDRVAASASARWLIGVILALAIVALLWLLLVPRGQRRATMPLAKPEQLTSVAPCIWRARS